MSDSLAKQLIAAVSASWNDRAAVLLGCSSTLSLLTSREVTGEGMTAALAVATTWPTAFAVECTSAAGGIVVCLFKSNEAEEIDRLVKQSGDGLPRPGGRALIESLLEGVAAALASDPMGKPSFGPATHIDLTIDNTRLNAIVKDTLEIGTFSLSIGEEINSQALVLFAANGSLQDMTDVTAASSDGPAPENDQTPKNGTGKSADRSSPRNMERLLDVELDVVVRFGITTVPLRDVVRMGVGTMIELNRAVDEPVELLVNGRSLARGEVVVVDGYYGVRITEIGPASERAASIV